VQKNPAFPTNCLAGTSKPNTSYNTKKHKQQLLANTNKIKPNDTKAGLRAFYTIRPGNRLDLFYSCHSTRGANIDRHVTKYKSQL